MHVFNNSPLALSVRLLFVYMVCETERVSLCGDVLERVADGP